MKCTDVIAEYHKKVRYKHLHSVSAGHDVGKGLQLILNKLQRQAACVSGYHADSNP